VDTSFQGSSFHNNLVFEFHDFNSGTFKNELTLCLNKFVFSFAQTFTHSILEAINFFRNLAHCTQALITFFHVSFNLQVYHAINSGTDNKESTHCLKVCLMVFLRSFLGLLALSNFLISNCFFLSSLKFFKCQINDLNSSTMETSSFS